jgi:hypothetical protein
MRLEFSAPSSSRPVRPFNFNYERQAALNAALLEGAEVDLPPSSSGTVREVRRLVTKGLVGQRHSKVRKRDRGGC